MNQISINKSFVTLNQYWFLTSFDYQRIYKTEESMYFDQPGKDNTDQTLAYALERGKQLGLKVVVATSTGKTAYKAIEVLKGGLIKIANLRLKG